MRTLDGMHCYGYAGARCVDGDRRFSLSLVRVDTMTAFLKHTFAALSL